MVWDEWLSVRAQTALPRSREAVAQSWWRRCGGERWETVGEIEVKSRSRPISQPILARSDRVLPRLDEALAYRVVVRQPPARAALRG